MSNQSNATSARPKPATKRKSNQTLDIFLKLCIKITTSDKGNDKRIKSLRPLLTNAQFLQSLHEIQDPKKSLINAGLAPASSASSSGNDGNASGATGASGASGASGATAGNGGTAGTAGTGGNENSLAWMEELPQWKICEISIALMQHLNHNVYLFGVSLFDVCLNNIPYLMFPVLRKQFFVVTTPQWMDTSVISVNAQNSDNIDKINCRLKAMNIMWGRVEEACKMMPKFSGDLQTFHNCIFYATISLMGHALSFAQLLATTDWEEFWRQAPVTVPPLKTQILLVKFWTTHARCIPNFKSFRTLFLVRWLAKLPFDFESRPVDESTGDEGLVTVRKLLNLITKGWTALDVDVNSETIETVQSVLGFLGGVPVTARDAKKSVATEVSPLLCRVIQRLPAHSIEPMMDKFSQTVIQLSSESLSRIVSTMFKWPMGREIYPWVLGILECLTKSMRSQVVYECAVHHAVHVAKQLRDPQHCQGALEVVRWLLLGIQPPRPPEAFHNCLSSILAGLIFLQSRSHPSTSPPSPTTTASLAHDVSLGVDSHYYSTLLTSLVELTHVLLYLFPGFPGKYDGLMQFLHAHRLIALQPSESRLRDILQKSTWPQPDRSGMVDGDTARAHDSYSNSSRNYAAPWGRGSGAGSGSGSPKSRANRNRNRSSRSGADWDPWAPGGKYSSSYHSYQYTPSYQSSLYSKRSAATDKAGLTNLGATCYMNSFMQALYLSDNFRKRLLTMKLEFDAQSAPHNSNNPNANGADSNNNSSSSSSDSTKSVTNVKNDEQSAWLSSLSKMYSLPGARLNEGQWKQRRNKVFEMQRVFARLNYTKRQAVYTRSFVTALGAPWVAGRQQDSSEFGKFVLDTVWETLQQATARDEYVRDTPAKGVHARKDNDASGRSSLSSRNGRNGAFCKRSSSLELKTELMNELSIDPYFGGLLRYATRCFECGRVSSRLEAVTEFALSFDSDEEKQAQQYTTHRMMESYLKNEILEGDNAYFCDSCQKKVKAQRALSCIHTPRHLIVCFKRFNWDRVTKRRGKISHAVDCPLILKVPIQNFDVDDDEPNRSLSNLKSSDKDDDVIMDQTQPSTTSGAPGSVENDENDENADASNNNNSSSSSSSSSSATGSIGVNGGDSAAMAAMAATGAESDESEMKEETYVLYAAVIHSGKSAEFGHYYTIGRHSSDALMHYRKGDPEQGPWYTFNDSSVSTSSYSALKATGQYMRTDVPYMLFYRRVDKIKDLKEKENKDAKDDVVGAVAATATAAATSSTNKCVGDTMESGDVEMNGKDQKGVEVKEVMNNIGVEEIDLWQKEIEDDNKEFEKGLKEKEEKEMSSKKNNSDSSYDKFRGNN